jgi:hypothetical protein
VQVAFGASSLLDAAPLAALIATYITAGTPGRVAAAYDEGRRLWVRISNPGYNQTSVWSMSPIAKDNRPGALEL